MASLLLLRWTNMAAVTSRKNPSKMPETTCEVCAACQYCSKFLHIDRRNDEGDIHSISTSVARKIHHPMDKEASKFVGRNRFPIDCERDA